MPRLAERVRYLSSIPLDLVLYSGEQNLDLSEIMEASRLRGVLGKGKDADDLVNGSVLQASIDMQSVQYSSESRMHVEERTASVMVQTFRQLRYL